MDAFAAAAAWRAAADLGVASAMANIAECYEKGKGVEVNVQQAALWYKKARDAGERYVVLLLCVVGGMLTGHTCFFFFFLCLQSSGNPKAIAAIERMRAAHEVIMHHRRGEHIV